MVRKLCFISTKRSTFFFFQQDISALSDINSPFDEIEFVNSLFKNVVKNEKEVSLLLLATKQNKFLFFA